MATRLILIRHGQSIDNIAGRLSGWHESDLTPLGHLQAQRMAQHVAEAFQPTVVYASPLRRTAQTAEPLARLLGQPIRFRDDLRELHFGVFEGRTLSEIIAEYPEEWERARNNEESDLDFAWRGGESRRAFYERISNAILDLVQSHADESIAVVSHGGVLSSLVAWAIEGQPQRWRHYQIDNCSWSEALHEDGEITVARWNVCDHLLTMSVETS